MRRWWSVAAALVLTVGVGGAAGAAGGWTPPAPSGGTGTLVGSVMLAGNTPVAGEKVHVYTQFLDSGTFYAADSHVLTTGADGTYSVDLAYATGYYVEMGNGAFEDSTSTLAFGGLTPWIASDGVTQCDFTAAPDGPGVWSDGDCSPAYVSVERFWSPGFNNAHFFTTSKAEAAHIKAADRNWTYEGRAFDAFGVSNGECTDGSPVHRFYSSRFQSHFYTIDQAEADHIKAADRNWTYEGIAYCAVSSAGTDLAAVHRFWSPVFGKHFYTIDQAEADHIKAVDRNWTYEGIAFYVVG